MLYRSRNLEELAFICPRHLRLVFDIFPVTKSYWPKLKSIQLGTLAYYQPAPEFDRFARFLATHPSLEEIHFLYSEITTHNLSFYIPDLPNLRSFTGKLKDIQRARNLPHLQYINLVSPHSPPTLFTINLRHFPTISRLHVELNTPDLSLVNNHDFYLCLFNLPRLRYLDVSTSGFVCLSELSTALRVTTKLQSLALTRIYNPQETVHMSRAGAAELFKTNPNLLRLLIRGVEQSRRFLIEWAEYELVFDRLGGGSEDGTWTVSGHHTVFENNRVNFLSSLDVMRAEPESLWGLLRSFLLWLHIMLFKSLSDVVA
ncbi:hypothetical protein DXG01_012095 [Tephrocybe rancida]|nr:hypothetical protein DXG01_012095 [Tephrocybe rancida]